jgi:nucleoside-diphosphate-sugar epimerase
MPTYLVTGGAGFIGCNIVRELIKRGDKVRVLDNLSTGTLDNLKDVGKQYEFINGDIRSMPAVVKSVEGVDYILHQAALRAVARSIDNPLDTNDVNVNGTLNILLAARDAKVKSVVYASSSSAYGTITHERNVETICPRPESPYALTKLTGEHYCRIFAQLWQLPTVSLRYFNVFGPYQSPRSKYAAVIPIFVQALLKGESPIIEWDGDQSRDFTHVSNVVSANILAAEGALKHSGEVYNVACGETTSVNEMLGMIQRLLGTNIKPKYVPKRAGDIRKTHADITKVQRDLGYKPVAYFEEGLRKSIEWYKQTLCV